jgi:hypothetical protein
MNSKPILFSGEMVKAILEKRKTQTRRVISLIDFEKSGTVGYDFAFRSKSGAWNEVPQEWLIRKYCPYGQPGDQLWVRETWKCEELDSGLDGVRFAADGAFREIENTFDASNAWGEANRKGGKWRPSIFMPRWASRITLEIVSVLVERVQEITKEDAKAEGVSNLWRWDAKRNSKHPEHFRRAVLNPYVANYSVLWDEINSKRGFGWDVNPWVWVVGFKVLEVRDAK